MNGINDKLTAPVPADTNVRYVGGVGEARAKAFAKLGVETLGDLVAYFPRADEDRSVIKPLSMISSGESATVIVTAATDPRVNYTRSGKNVVNVRFVDDTGTLHAVFFNQTYMRDNISVGEAYSLYGKFIEDGRRLTVTNPIVEPVTSATSKTGRIMPIYRQTAGLTSAMIARAVECGLKACGDSLPDPIPEAVQKSYELARLRYSYANIHFPESWEALELARRRFIFEELFVLSCALGIFKGGKSGKKGLKFGSCDLTAFYGALPFTPTGAQVRAIDAAVADMQSGRPMSRLLQGDVGSGKTLVAAALCCCAAQSGYQSAVMAPTEILAEQHLKTLAGFLEPLGIRVELLTGGMTAKQKRETREKIALGECDVVVGTHALLSEDVRFSSLGFVVADEQHRFGVQQRAALSEKGDCPHVLVMSATPIPRTLALIIYGDLDVSIIDELPKGRMPVKTYAVGEDMRERVYRFIRRLCGEGRQVYVVCRMVEEADDGDEELKNVKQYAAKLKTEVFPDLRVGLVHGKMKAQEKNSVMRDFSEGKIDVLVATTVIEVGVDVPNAALMVVENADGFGLSQLHQLRGRVGRGQYESYCILMYGQGTDTSKERLRAMCTMNDGFKIAEEDLKLRGPGDFFGSRQHGLPELHVANFASDVQIMQIARGAAEAVLKEDPHLSAEENAQLHAHVYKMIERNKDTFN